MVPNVGLFLVSKLNNIGRKLATVQKQVKNTLYIQIIDDSTLSFPVRQSCSKTSKTIKWIYTQASIYCGNLDVRVLLSSLKYGIFKISTQKTIDLIIIDKYYTPTDIDNFVADHITNIVKYDVITLDSHFTHDNSFDILMNEIEPDDTANHVATGGTFDRLHIPHKLILTETILRSNSKITVGVSDDCKLQKKVLSELIQVNEERVKNVIGFIKDICPQMDYEIIMIKDAYGCSIDDTSMEMIIVSPESAGPSSKVNEIREKKNLPKLRVRIVDFIKDSNPDVLEGSIISSTAIRKSLLGTLIKPVENNYLSKKPYVIFLTGGIASGLSEISGRLHELGALIIDYMSIENDIHKSDELVVNGAKEVVQIKPSDTHKSQNSSKSFGFAVWKKIETILKQSNQKVVVIEADFLLEPECKHYCHEIWSCIAPEETAVERLSNNGLSTDEALARKNAQASKKSYVQASNVVLSTLRSEHYTQQVNKAWNLLQERMAI